MPLIPTNPGPVLKAGWQALNWARRLARRDHTTVYSGMWAKSNFGRTCITLAIACGPSKPFRRGRRVDHHRALDFFNAVIPDGFTMPPTSASASDVSFQVQDPALSNSWDLARVGQVWSNGLVELLVRPATASPDADKFVVDLLSVARPIYDMASAIRQGGYRSLYDLRTRGRRLDWVVYLANYVSDATSGHRYWSDLDFPGRRPLMRATNAWPAAPNLGIGFMKLRSRRQRTDPERIVRAVLDDLLSGSGWLEENNHAIDDVIAALHGEHQASLARASTATP